jgi:hypothetical protein
MNVFRSAPMRVGFPVLAVALVAGMYALLSGRRHGDRDVLLEQARPAGAIPLVNSAHAFTSVMSSNLVPGHPARSSPVLDANPPTSSTGDIETLFAFFSTGVVAKANPYGGDPLMDIFARRVLSLKVKRLAFQRYLGDGLRHLGSVDGDSVVTYSLGLGTTWSVFFNAADEAVFVMDFEKYWGTPPRRFLDSYGHSGAWLGPTEGSRDELSSLLLHRGFADAGL